MPPAADSEQAKSISNNWATIRVLEALRGGGEECVTAEMDLSELQETHDLMKKHGFPTFFLKYLPDEELSTTMKRTKC